MRSPTHVSARPPRITRQRATISAALDKLEGFRTAQEIHAVLRQKGSRVGLATVYRTLQGLASAAEVDIVRSDEGELLYRRCKSNDHHHHLVCRRCGRSVEVKNAQVEMWTKRIAGRHGFSQVTHTLEIYGLCRECS